MLNDVADFDGNAKPDLNLKFHHSSLTTTLIKKRFFPLL